MRKLTSTLTVVTLAAATACAETPTQPRGGDPTERIVSSTQRGITRRLTMDEEWALLAKTEIPGFAGHYLNAAGEPVVLVTDTQHATRAQEHVRSLRSAQQRAALEVRTRVVRYDFAELFDWKNLVLATLRGAGLVVADIDESSNSLYIEVEVSTDTAVIRRTLSDRGVPSEAINIVYGEPLQPSSDLDNSFRPIRGGTRFETIGGCSIGFTGRTNTVPKLAVFYTASHCSVDDFSNGGDGGFAYQPTSTTPAIGYEWLDVPLANNRRDSDASIFVVTDSSALNTSSPIGTIVRTYDREHFVPGSKIQDLSRPYFQVIAKESVTQNTRVDKV